MEKNHKQYPYHTDSSHKEKHLGLSSMRKILRRIWLAALCLSVTGGIIVALFMNKTSWMDNDGTLHEPLFGLIPISFFLLFFAVMLGLADMFFTFRQRR